MPTFKGSFKLFTLARISVYLHWSWFLIAIYSIEQRRQAYSGIWGNVAEYLALFLMVLAHEFGHQLACRQVGGETHNIVLWPLGGVAYVSPPQRAGAQLWSIVAGPLVNVVLVPVLVGLLFVSSHLDWPTIHPDLHTFIRNVCYMNAGLLLFNLLPIYPLDGGQILRSLLWFFFGRAKSLLIATIIGLVGVAGLIGLALYEKSVWFGIMSVFILMNCWGGLKQALALGRVAKIPRRSGFACPSCKSAPPSGPLWKCGKCGQTFDTFLTGATCPQCRTYFPVTQCLDCGKAGPIETWAPAPKAPAGF